MKKRGIFQLGNFELHSGKKSEWKIECDMLVEEDYKTLAHIVAKEWKLKFGLVMHVGAKVNYGGRIANSYEFKCALKQYETRTLSEQNPILIVDDVLTTGHSINEEKRVCEHIYDDCHCDIVGVVIFARGECPDWVKSIFQFERTVF
ncbi:unnamed protein product [marine sediment metagenome]|uniref:Phosphoribosyltransferase domain-containing protein n=1 Tax=marine sediment metagenome TaxID=412755 RepID=X1F6U7_9ZZZZ